MGVIKVVLSDELEEKFRKEVFERKGMKKGNLSKSATEAIKLWLEASGKEKEEAEEEAEEEVEKETEEEVPAEEEESGEEESWSLSEG